MRGSNEEMFTQASRPVYMCSRKPEWQETITIVVEQ